MLAEFDNSTKRVLSVFDNEYVSAALSLFLILYAAFAAPRLPERMVRWFDNPLFKLVIFFLIAYMSRKNPTVAIIAAVAVLVTLITLNRYNMNRTMMNAAHAAMAEESAVKSTEGMAGVTMDEDFGHQGEEMMPEEVLADLQEEAACTKNVDYRDEFYPQYVNMKPDAYMARYTGNDISGFDSTAKYASI